MSEQRTPDIRFLREQLIPDLLSGAHRQTVGVLRRHVEADAERTTLAYCCLGRVCELWLADHPDDAGWDDYGGDNGDADAFLFDVHELHGNLDRADETLPSYLQETIFATDESSGEGFGWKYEEALDLIDASGVELRNLSNNARTWLHSSADSAYEGPVITMAGMNDHGFTFEQIAKIVSAHLDRLEARDAISGE